MNNIDMGDVYSSAGVGHIGTAENLLQTSMHITNFDIIGGDGLPIAEEVKIATDYNFITVANPAQDAGQSVASTNLITLKDALVGYYAVNEKGNTVLAGHYNVDWNTTSLWHEMTNFQNSTVKRFFGIWGYFRTGETPQKYWIGPEEKGKWIFDGQQVQAYQDDNFIDPAKFTSITEYENEIQKHGYNKQLCGSLLKLEDIRTYYRVPKYDLNATREDDDISKAWILTQYIKPSPSEAEALIKRVKQSSVTEAMYHAVRMEEALPIECYDSSTITTAIAAQAEIADLFRQDEWRNTSVGKRELAKYPTNIAT